MSTRNQRGLPDEVPSRARRTRRRGGLDRQEPAEPPVRAGARRGPAPRLRWHVAGLRVRLRGLQPGHRRCARGRRRRGPGLWTAARRDHQGAAGQARRRGGARFTLPTMPVEDYPTLPEMPATAGTVDAATFAAAVAQVAIAAGRDDTLPLFTGVRVELTGNTLALLATDRYRLAVRELEWRPDDPGVNVAALVPARTLADTAKALGPLGGSVTVALARGGVGEGMIGFSGATRRTTSRLLEGEFPKVRSLRPDTHSAQAKVPVAALQEVVRRVALVAERATPVRLSFSDDGLVVEAGGSEDARASEAMDCAYSGEPMTIAFNHQYLLDGLAALDGPVAVMSFTDAKKPAIVAPATEEGEATSGYWYLIMPVRIGG